LGSRCNIHFALADAAGLSAFSPRVGATMSLFIFALLFALVMDDIAKDVKRATRRKRCLKPIRIMRAALKI